MSNTIKAVLFDLDDTLYEEMTFVESGFHAVSTHISNKFNFNKAEVHSSLMGILSKHGRGRVFNKCLEHYGLYNSDLVKDMVEVYRSHHPDICLDPDAISTLKGLRMRGIKLGVITDGLCSVQKNKVRALGLKELVDIIIYTDEIGKEYWKPHSIAFQLAANSLEIEPHEAIYVGNDPTKDFAGPNSIGMQSVHLCRNKHPIEKSCNASIHIAGLDEVIPNIIMRNRK